MKNYAIGHFLDVDGVSSHVILHRRDAIRNIETVHIDVTYKDPAAAFSAATPENGETVRFFDLGYNPVLDQEMCLAELSRLFQLGTIEIYDHHTYWPPESRVYGFAKKMSVPRRGNNLERLCTSQILISHFNIWDETSMMLARTANASDFGSTSPYHDILGEYAEELSLAVAGANARTTDLTALGIINWLSHSVGEVPYTSEDLLRSRSFWPNSFRDSAQSYRIEIAAAKPNLIKSCSLLELRIGEKVLPTVIGFGDQLLYMKEGVATLMGAFPGFPIYACVHPDGSIIFSRNTEEVNLALLGTAFNGGGREAGSGGFIPEDVKGKGQEAMIKEVTRIIKGALANIS